ncbi:ABC transporter permease [Micromonospora sp. WMMD558]|uniref:ABC transporter permease n=1 Tax=Micromonospora sp. WMMD558 TaxID=3403462 RepID=UPI003BF50BB3
MPYAGNGLLIAVTTLTAAALLLGLRIPASALPALLLTLAVAALSCGFFGLTLGAVGLRFRDVWLVSNVSVALLLLLTGVNVPAADLPVGMRVAGQLLPITHAAEAARRLSAGDGLSAAAGPLAAEAAVGLGYALLAAALLKLFEAESRRHASLDTL